MQIYIASSWKNQHAVQMLTTILREGGYTILSFVENNYGECHETVKKFDFEDWVKTPKAQQSFEYDTKGATESDLVIYIAPSGTDAWAEIGAAWASKVPVFGLWSKGEPSGLMRKMVSAWFNDFRSLLDAVKCQTSRQAPPPAVGSDTASNGDSDSASTSTGAKL